MNKLITVTPLDDVTDEYKKEAKTWTKWDSKSRKKFPYNYQQEERVLILEGEAILTPTTTTTTIAGTETKLNPDTAAREFLPEEIKIKAGEAVTFHVGFKCKWQITKRMKKHYTVIVSGEEGEEEVAAAAAITCDICSTDCVAESYFVKQEEIDICPDCYQKDDLNKYQGAEHQKEGEKWVAVTATATKNARSPPKKKRKKKE